MRNLLWVMLLISGLMMLCLSCAPAPRQVVGGDITVVITDDSQSTDGYDAHIENYAKGDTASVNITIVNQSSDVISPTIYARFNVDPSKYSMGVGYSPTPRYFSDWVDIPKCGKIEKGMAKSYSVSIIIPSNAPEDIPSKWAFKVGVDPHLGNPVTACWWRVEMRE